MSNFVVILLCLVAGMGCRRLPQFPSNSGQPLNLFIIFLSLPALILVQIPRLMATPIFSGAWWIPVSMSWLGLAVSLIVFYRLSKRFGWSKATTGALILVAGLGNTSFVGFPLLEALLSARALPIGILVDEPGSFLALATFGIVIAASFSGGHVTARTIFRRVLTFPPMIALISAFVWGAAGTPGGNLLFPVFEKIAATLVPLALFAVGFQLKFDKSVLKKRWIPLTLGLGFKMLLMPALCALFYVRLIGNHDFATEVTVLESAMASMISAVVVVSDFDLDSELANLMVGIGIPLSLISVPAWEYALRTLYW